MGASGSLLDHEIETRKWQGCQREVANACNCDSKDGEDDADGFIPVTRSLGRHMQGGESGGATGSDMRSIRAPRAAVVICTLEHQMAEDASYFEKYERLRQDHKHAVVRQETPPPPPPRGPPPSPPKAYDGSPPGPAAPGQSRHSALSSPAPQAYAQQCAYDDSPPGPCLYGAPSSPAPQAYAQPCVYDGSPPGPCLHSARPRPAPQAYAQPWTYNDSPPGPCLHSARSRPAPQAYAQPWPYNESSPPPTPAAPAPFRHIAPSSPAPQAYTRSRAYNESSLPPTPAASAPLRYIAPSSPAPQAYAQPHAYPVRDGSSVQVANGQLLGSVGLVQSSVGGMQGSGFGTLFAGCNGQAATPSASSSSTIASAVDFMGWGIGSPSVGSPVVIEPRQKRHSLPDQRSSAITDLTAGTRVNYQARTYAGEYKAYMMSKVAGRNAVKIKVEGGEEKVVEEADLWRIRVPADHLRSSAK